MERKLETGVLQFWEMVERMVEYKCSWDTAWCFDMAGARHWDVACIWFVESFTVISKVHCFC